jgi:probable F420-dependent oxidoreductase
MKLGAVIRLMGPQSDRDILVECVRAAEDAGLDDFWVPDHIAIPPDDAEGSGGRYLDPLTSLAYLAALTTRIGLGTGILNLPYRPALPTAKALATIQELSGGRLRVGVGVGWMEAEFRALGVERGQRGRITDETLAFFQRCFSADEVEANGQPFLFLPRPLRPPIYIGGAAPHALERAARYGDGWLPMTGEPAQLAPDIAKLRELAAEAGKPPPEVILMTGFGVDDAAAVTDHVRALADVGVTQIAFGTRYAEAADFRRAMDALAEHVLPAVRAI